jgi:glycosyltransferase involved in cell wall biosynthesis
MNRRILMVEPQGEGGISHFTYCLSNALVEAGVQVTLATAHPYELAAAPHTFALTQPFGQGALRHHLQRLRRPAALPTSALHAQPLAAIPDMPTVYQTRGLARVASQRLALHERARGWQAVCASAEREACDVIHIQWHEELLAARSAIMRLRHQGRRIVLTAHNVLPHEPETQTRTAWAALYRLMDRIIVLYPKATIAMQELGIDPARIAFVPHGNYLSIAAFAQGDAPLTQAEARQRLELPQDAPIAAFFGLIRPYKGIEVLIAAYAELRQRLPDARLLIAGRATKGFGAVKHALSANHQTEAVTVIPGYLSLRDVTHCLAAADVVVLPYLADTASGVAHLAYACRRPIIASRVGVFPDLIVEGVTGRLVAPGDAQALAEALWQMERDRAMCMACGEAGYAFAQTDYAWAPIAEATRQVYDTVRAQSSGKR